MRDWDLGRTILRQDEVARFIHGTKGEKYSALLPLFGLQELEVAAQNVRQLAKEIERQFEIGEIRTQLRLLEPNRKRVFGNDNDNQIVEKIEALHAKHASDKKTTVNNLVRCDEIVAALETRIGRLNAEQRRHLAITNAAEINLKENIDSIQAGNAKLAGAVEPMIPVNDVWIAALAIESGLPLLARDEHFSRVSGLTVIQC
jgi:predicted nucleic acid-binding protein